MTRILLSLLCMTLFATNAAAECAWVLWSDVFLDSTTEPAGKVGETWSVIKADTTKAGCEKQLKVVLADYGTWLRQHMADRVESFSTSGDSFAVTWKPRRDEIGGKIGGGRYVCLPSDVDPRGPKGGGR